MMPIDTQNRKEVLAFHCNFNLPNGRPCACQLDVGWLAGCSHVFCDAHAREWFSENVDCPVCQNSNAVRTMKVNFTFTATERKIKMIGFAPSEVLDAASKAFDWWASQKLMENTWIDKAVGKLQQHEHRMREGFQTRRQQAIQIMESLKQKEQILQKKLNDTVAVNDSLKSERDKVRARLKELKQKRAALQEADAKTWDATSMHRPTFAQNSTSTRSSKTHCSSAAEPGSQTLQSRNLDLSTSLFAPGCGSTGKKQGLPLHGTISGDDPPRRLRRKLF